MERSSNMEQTRKRHCWECLRRCLVCDSAKPGCNRCAASGTACPGYDDVKPTRLKWLAPGRVTSRKRRQKVHASPSPTSTTSGEVENAHEEIVTRTLTAIAQATHTVPTRRLEMSNDPSILLQGAEYFNACIYQDLLPINELGQNPHIFLVMPNHLQMATSAPDYLRYGMVCMTLSHRMNRMSQDPQSRALAEKFYVYRGIAIRSLSEQLNADRCRTDDFLIAGVLTLLLNDCQHSATLNPSWRFHLKGLQKLINLRGGFHALAGLKSIEPMLLSIWFIAVIGNTTCPGTDLADTGFHLDAVDLILEHYSDAVSPFQMCPPSLFADIIRVNRLRMLATQGGRDLSQVAYEILGSIDTFSSEQWAGSKSSSKGDWNLIGDVYKAAVVLYCINSFQSLSILPQTTPLRTRCASQGQVLHELLERGLVSPRTKSFMLWPLVVLGVEAVRGGVAMRAFVGDRLRELSRDHGTYVPLTAKGVLEAFWASGETSWEACFDQPYAFTMQIAVDISRIVPTS